MRFAMVFPGQGSQSAGMLAGYGDMPAIRETLAEASDVLKQDLAKLIAEGPAEELNSTVNTQPVMVTAGICAWRAWQESGGSDPALLAGHSLGEYTALVVAGAISFAECLPLVRLRGRAMQEAVPQGAGAMAAILGLDDEAVRSACAEAAEGDVCEAVNFNAPGQVVIAGHAGAVRRAIEAAKARGAKRAMPLPVSAPFHSSLMAPAAAKLREALDRIAVSSPRIPVIHNVDAKSRSDASGVREALVTQADHPVRWVECVREIAARGARHVFECGPGKVLAPLVRRTVEGLQGIALADRAGLEQAAQLSKTT
ncbi:MAG: ACP S-malonyltransferase [Betaproteobacteria bacterium]|nr:MAG: ACP S-malonyltransferase [Betaproteobacteria bacterium]